MQLRQLEHFEAVYRLRSFAGAAAESFVTQSALSRSIKSLEESLEQRLFDRDTHGVQPTVAADALIHHARDVLAAAKALQEAAVQLKGDAIGHVRIGAGPYPAQPLITTVVRRMSTRHPGIQVSVVAGTSDGLLSALQQRDLDFVVCNVSKFRDTPGSEALEIIELPGEPLVVVVADGHPAARGKLRTRDLAACPWALPTPSPEGIAQLVELLGKDRVSTHFPTYRLETTAACLDVVQDGRTVTVVPLSLAKTACPRGGLSYRRVWRGARTHDGIHLLRRRTRSPAVARAMQEVAQVAADLASAAQPGGKARRGGDT